MFCPSNIFIIHFLLFSAFQVWKSCQHGNIDAYNEVSDQNICLVAIFSNFNIKQIDVNFVLLRHVYHSFRVIVCLSDCIPGQNSYLHTSNDIYKSATYFNQQYYSKFNKTEPNVIYISLNYTYHSFKALLYFPFFKILSKLN